MALRTGEANSLALTNGTKAFNNINIASNTVKLLLSAVLVPLCGVNGAVTAVLIHEIVRFGMFYHQFTAREAVLVQSEQTLLSQGD
jgi:hypothetical protein